MLEFAKGTKFKVNVQITDGNRKDFTLSQLKDVFVWAGYKVNGSHPRVEGADIQYSLERIADQAVDITQAIRDLTEAVRDRLGPVCQLSIPLSSN